MNYGNEKGIRSLRLLMFSMRGSRFAQTCATAVSRHPDVYDIELHPNEFLPRADDCTFVGFPQPQSRRRAAGYKSCRAYHLPDGHGSDEWWVNMSRVNGSTQTDPYSTRRAEIICAEQNEETYAHLKDTSPVFENALVDRSLRSMGIRETRRMSGTTF